MTKWRSFNHRNMFLTLIACLTFDGVICQLTHKPTNHTLFFKNIGIKLCQYKCIQSGFCRALKYAIPTLTCHLSDMDRDTTANETQYLIGRKDLANVRAGPCQLKTCPNMKCLETQSGKTECVNEKRNPTEAYTELNTTLLDACRVGDVTRVKLILAHGQADINSRGKLKNTPVMYVAMGGHEELFDLLVREGATLSLLNNEGENILHLACTGGSVKIVKYILTHNIVGINSCDDEGFTPIMNAAIKGRKDVFDLLVGAAADLFQVNNYEETILHVACEGGNVEIVKYLMKHNIMDIESRDSGGWTPVMQAASDGHKDVFDVLIQVGADLSSVDYENVDILHFACMGGNVEIVKYILTQNIVDINRRDTDGLTPVMTAALYKRKGVFNLLVEEGANMLLVNKVNETILHLACKGGNVEIVTVIVTNNTEKINSRDIKGWTPVMQAVNAGHKDVFDVLVQAGADLSQGGNRKETILHVSCEKGNVEIIKYLLTHEIVDVDSQDAHGWTPVMRAAKDGHGDVFDILVEWGADLSLRDYDHNNILHLACWQDCVQIVKYLITHNIVDINSRDGKQRTPAMIAAHLGHEAVFFLLVDHGADLTVANDVGDNILNLACEGKNVRIVKYVSTRHIVEGPYREDDPC